jgi:hypothetical protein
LVLSALFFCAAAKSWATANVFMISPPMVGWWLLADHDEILPLITAISWQTYETLAHNECWREDGGVR